VEAVEERMLARLVRDERLGLLEALESGEKLRAKSCLGRPAAGAPDAILPPRAWPGTNP
jgi:hypothetical protein